MKVCFIGMGSIAARHLENLQSICKQRKIELQVDLLRKTNKLLTENIVRAISRQYHSYRELPADYDVVFITNPTSLHYQTLTKIISKAKHIFMEKPIFENSRYEIENIMANHQGIAYVACPLRYTKILQYLKTNVDFSKVFSVRAICSSYLPDWRPNTDYRQSYSARRELGGGVHIDLIHEWDYLIYLLGIPNKTKCLAGKYSDLEVNSNDIAIYIAEFSNSLVSLHLDYFGRQNKRELEIYTAEEVIVADIIKGEVVYQKAGKVIDLGEERNAYQKLELEYFLDMLSGKAANTNSFQQALTTLKIVEGEF